MSLVSWCPRCPLPVSGGAEGFLCDAHGEVPPLWRPVEIDYAAFGEVLRLGRPLPTYVPWPLSPGWRVADAACVTDAEGLATASTTVGTSSLDGEVSVTVVTEEPGVGLGARVAGLEATDAGEVLTEALGRGSPAVRVRLDQRTTSLWSVPSGADDDVLATSVFAGEAGGRWLWLVVRPASAALLLRDEWLFADASGFGPEAVEMPFGGQPPGW